MIQIISTYAGVLAALLALDGVWLGLVARKFYANEFGSLMRDNPVWWAAGLFYVLYAAGLVYLVIAPNANAGLAKVLVAGAVLGAVAYMTYDLTSYAVTSGFPWKIIVPDILWGALATTVASLAGYYVWKAFI